MDNTIPCSRQKTILVVEDDEELCSMIKAILSAPGLRIINAGDGFTALKMAREFPPDLIMLDLGLPLMDGHEFLSILRKHPSTSHIPVLVCTGNRDLSTVVELKEFNIAGYIAKPFYSEMLKNQVEQILKIGTTDESN